MPENCRNCHWCCYEPFFEELTDEQNQLFLGARFSVWQFEGKVYYQQEEWCVNLLENGRCKLSGHPLQPQVCLSITPGSDYCIKVLSSYS